LTALAPVEAVSGNIDDRHDPMLLVNGRFQPAASWFT